MSNQDTNMIKSLSYKPLFSSEKQIRLIKLFRGEWDDKICCELIIVSLLDKPVYEALSYVWEDMSDTVEIAVNGSPFSATRNLHAALRRLRSQAWTLEDAAEPLQADPEGVARTHWVDAVCINQQDFKEKEIQVAMMGEIYSNTAHGLLWLGEEPEEPAPALDQSQRDAVDLLLQQADEFVKNISAGFLWPQEQAVPSPPPQDAFVITKCRPEHWAAGFDPRNLTAEEQANVDADSIYQAFNLLRVLSMGAHLDHIAFLRVEAQGEETWITNARRALHWLASRPWWTRIWTIPWGLLLAAIYHFQRHRTACCSEVPGVHDMLNFLVDTVLPCQNLQSYWQRPDKELTGPANDQGDSEVTLLSLFRPESLLWTFRSREATNPRDKIYGILSLIRAQPSFLGGGTARDVLIPDYNPDTTAEMVFARAVKSIIDLSTNLDILCQPGHAQRDPCSKLPSWVADFPQSLAFAGTLDRFTSQLPHYDACAGTRASVMTIEENILVMEGVLVDKIDRNSTGMMYLAETSQLDVFKEWHTFAKGSEISSKGSAGDWRQVFWRTLCGDTVRVSGPFHVRNDFEAPLRRIPPLSQAEGAGYEEAAFNDWCEGRGLPELQTGTAAGSDVQQEEASAFHTIAGNIAHTIKISTASRKFFFSTGGCMGLAPFHSGLTYPTKDEIFIFPGGRVPFVLRYAGMRHIPASKWLFGTALFKEAFKCLKPGGYLQSHEPSSGFEQDGEPFDENSALSQWGEIFVKGSIQFGRPLTVFQDQIQRKAMEAAGFVDIEERDNPVGARHKDPKMKEIGQYSEATFLEDPKGYMMFFAHALEWTNDEIEMFLLEFRRELKSTDNQPFYRHKVV